MYICLKFLSQCFWLFSHVAYCWIVWGGLYICIGRLKNVRKYKLTGQHQQRINKSEATKANMNNGKITKSRVNAALLIRTCIFCIGRLNTRLLPEFQYLSIQIFCYVLFVQIFLSKIVLFSSQPVVDMSSCIFPQFSVDFFSCFVMS